MFQVQTLPFTGETAVTGYTVNILAFRAGRETVAFDGLLQRIGAVAAVIKNDGMGGETSINFTSDEEEQLFNEYVAMWAFGWSVNGSQKMAHNVETVVDTLAYEAMTVVARKQGKATRQVIV